MFKLRSDTSRGLTLAAPATLYVGLLVAAPLVILVAYSMWTQTYVSIDRTPTWANYRDLMLELLLQEKEELKIQLSVYICVYIH